MTSTLPVRESAVSLRAGCPTPAAMLVATSNVPFQMRLRECLPSEFGHIEAVAGGAEALAKLETGHYAAALLDYRLADLDSQEVYTTMRALYPDLQILWIDSENGARLSSESLQDCENQLTTVKCLLTALLGLAANPGGSSWRPYLELDTPARLTVAPLPNMIGSAPRMQELSRMARLVARRKTSVLLTGETGTGKELLARALHQMSPRAAASFVVINCAAIPEELLEAELFGCSRGAFTGAYQSRPGRLQTAHGGVLFFDEIGELPLAMQVKLLRFLENGEVQRLGSLEVQHLDVRVIAATNSPLLPKIAAGDFREDLYYRIAAFPLELPPLRERIADIAPIACHYLIHLCRENCLPQQWLSPAAISLLQQQTWPGNVRELEHALERASILADGDLELRTEHFAISPHPRICQ